MDQSEQETQFAKWLETHRQMLHKVANSFASGADRDDLMQEMLLSLWKALPAFRRDSKESTFTYRVINNCALTWVRGQSRRLHRETKAFEESRIQSESAGKNHSRLEMLYECIRELPPVDRSIITMSLDGLSYAEIGEVIGSKENAISVRIHRIRKQLTEAIERKGNQYEARQPRQHLE